MSQRLTVRLEDDLDEWVETEAERRDRSMAYIVRECVEMVARGDASDHEATQSDTQYATQDQLGALRADMNKLKSMLDDTTDGGAPPAAEKARSEDAAPDVSAPKTGLHDPENAAEWVIEHAPASRSEIIDACYNPDIAEVSADTWWVNYCRPALEDHGLEFVRNRGWEFDD